MPRPPRRWLTPEQEQDLREFVAERHPTTEEVIDAIRHDWGLSYSRTGMRNALLRVGAYLPHGNLRGKTQRWTIDPPAKKALG